MSLTIAKGNREVREQWKNTADLILLVCLYSGIKLRQHGRGVDMEGGWFPLRCLCIWGYKGVI